MRDFDRKPRFGGRDGGRDDRRPSFGRDFSRQPEMHDATCDKCGKETTVPFRPTGSKPVFCRDCFTRGDSRDSFEPRRDAPRAAPAMPSAELEEINKKLDKIMAALKIE